jgi:hypothetical protein
MRTRRSVLSPQFSILALWVVLSAWPAGAMVVVQRDFPELVARAEQIVVGTVTDIQNVTDAAGAASTLVTFSDLTVLKGDVGETLTLRLYGGRSGHMTVQISDMPTFRRGERDVLFVAGNNRDLCPLVGVWQGRFHVRFDATQAAEVVDDHDGNPVTGLRGRALQRAPLQANEAAMTLDEFRGRIADELAHPQDAGGPGNQ